MIKQGLLWDPEYIKELSQSFNNVISNFCECEVHRQIDLANQLCNGRVCFINLWDMEQCNISYPIPMDWTRTPNKDGEWVYALNRMEYVPSLIIAYAKTKDTRYQNVWYKLVSKQSQQYRKYNPQNGSFIKFITRLGRKTIGQRRYEVNRTLDSAIRACVLSSCLLLSRAAGLYMCDENDITDKIRKIVNELDQGFRVFDETSNWGIIILSSQIISLLITSYRLYEDEKRIQCYITRLVNTVKMQVSNSGVQCESSIMYHTQVTIYLLKVLYYCNVADVTIPPDLIEIIIKMCDFVYNITPPDNKQICFGDSDNTEMSSFFELAYNILGITKYRKFIKQKSEIVLKIDIVLSKIKNSILPENAKMLYCDAGINIMKNSFWYSVCFNTNHISGHSHGDMGEIVLYYNNWPVFIDAGRYTYRNCKLRRVLKAPASHTVLKINKGADWQFPDAWVCKKKPIHQKMGLYNNGTCSVTAMSYHSLIKKRQEAKVLRIVMMGLEDFIILDVVESSCPCEAYQNFIVSDYWNVLLETVSVKIANKGNELIVSSEQGNVLQMDTCAISPNYNELLHTSRIKIKKKVNNKACLATVVSAKKRNVSTKCIDNKVVINIQDVTDKKNGYQMVVQCEKSCVKIDTMHKDKITEEIQIIMETLHEH